MLNKTITSSLAIWMLFLATAIGQHHSNKIFEEINAKLNNGQAFSKIQMLSAESASINQNYQKTYSKANYWIQDSKSFAQLQASSPSYLSFELTDYQQNTLTVLLEKQELFGPDSRLLTSDDPEHGESIQSGLYYRGTIKEYPGSVAAFSFFEDQTMAVLALPEKGNMVLGKMKSSTSNADSDLPHVLYYENELPQKSSFQCGADLLPESFKSRQQLLAPDTIYSTHCKVSKVFLECDHQLYLDHNGSVTQVKNYITGLFNVVKTLYYNESLILEISDIMVWTNQDPFLHTDLASIIYNYAAYRKSNFTGNLAQLVTTYAPQQQGGIAFLGTLCQPFDGQSGPHSFAFIYNSYSQLPTYSWSVEVMTHEMGHTFSSPHTHACKWGPLKNMALDNCQPPEGNACTPGPAPTNGGTIMSYCHLVSYGINFSNGFGKEPGDLIRANVQNQSCLASQFIPIIDANVTGPYYDGDNIILRARPSNDAYSYDWYHYDYLMSTPKDSILRPTYSGIFKAAISNDCTENSKPDTVVINDFLVNLGCPIIHGFRDSVQASLTMNAKQSALRDTLTVPDSLYQKIPVWAKDVLVELHTKITPKGTTWTRDVTMAYQAPVATAIINSKYTPNSNEPASFNGEKTYSKILGRFNPKGDWIFTTNISRFSNVVDLQVTFSVVITWRRQDSIPPCDIALCDGQSKTFDAGIPGAKYLWSTGATTKTISTNQLGSLSVQVTKGSKKASHTVQLYNYQTNYSQAHTICSGDTVNIGKHHYTKAGNYSDTLSSFNGCDSVIASTIDVLPIQKSVDSILVCYGAMYDSLAYFKDAQFTFHHTAINGCDSIHLLKLKVNPEITIQSNAVPDCPEVGGSLEAIASGGFGTNYIYEWTNGKTTGKIDNLQSGIYQVKAIDENGCSVTKDVVLKNLDSANFVTLVFDVSCFGLDNGRIYVDFSSGPGPWISVWSTGETTKDLLNLKAGKYTIFARDNDGCRVSREIEVHTPDLLIDQVDVKGSTGNDGSAKTNVNGGTMPYTYLWSTGETTPEITGLPPGNYWVDVRDKNGCETRYDFAVDQITATYNVDQNSSFKIYPVPVNDKLTIECLSQSCNYSELNYKIYDVHLREWNAGKLNTNSKKHSVDVHELADGLYLLELRNEHSVVARKMFVKD